MRANGGRGTNTSGSGRGFGFGPSPTNQATQTGSTSGMFGYSGGNGVSSPGRGNSSSNNTTNNPNQRPSKTALNITKSIVSVVGNMALPGLGSLLGEGVEWASQQEDTRTPEQKARMDSAMDSTRGRGGDARPDDPYANTASPVKKEDATVNTADSAMDDKSKASDVAKDQKRKKKKSGSQTILTSPLGATETAKTAITKLGGS